ncbi:hypothetical protein FBF27_00300 [Candidatus Saccharibacteria bacterium oral taxon 488]|nr:hypothetical protein FBF27_00300 [Candidatus Saccharibacteria bacterium oral taxon 488]
MEEHLSANLMTPKRQLVKAEPGLRRELLLDSQQLKLIRAVYEQSPQTYDAATKAAVNIAQVVRQTVDFAPTSADSPLLNAVKVASREATNCFGHAIIASECLEQLGIEHCISYANQHAMVTLFDRGSERAFLLDVATEELCCDMTGVLGSGAPNPLDQLAMGELRAVNTFFSGELLKRLPPSIDRQKFMSSRPWLSFDAIDAAQSHEHKPRNRILQFLTLPSVPGRMLLIQQYNAARQVGSGDIETASKELSELSGLYLDVDSRNGLKEVDELCRRLILAGKYDEVIDLAAMVDESLVPDDKSKNKLFLPDIMRKIARQTENKELAWRAIKLYEENPPNSLRNGKLAAARKLLDNL